MTRLIGLTGRAGAGKDTVGSLLQRYGFLTAAFADPLKKMVATLAGEPLSNFYDRDLKEAWSHALGMPRRRALQLMGTELVRKHFGDDIWHRGPLLRWERCGKPATVFTDVRFDDEAKAIIAAGGVIVEIVRDVGEALEGAAANHASEAGISKGLISRTIINNGTIEALELEVMELVRQMVQRL